MFLLNFLIRRARQSRVGRLGGPNVNRSIYAEMGLSFQFGLDAGLRIGWLTIEALKRCYRFPGQSGTTCPFGEQC